MFLLFRQLRVILFSKRKINTKLQMLRRILLLISYHNTQLNSSFRTYQDCKIRLVLEDTNTLFISEDLLQKLFYEAPEGEERERQFQSVGFFSSETIFKERFSTALFCSKEVCMDTETYECSVQFYHYEGLNFAYSAGLTFLLSSSWHRLNLIWFRVSLSLTPPLPALTTREQKRAFVKSYLHFLPPHFSQLTVDISPLQLASSTAVPFGQTLLFVRAEKLCRPE